MPNYSIDPRAKEEAIKRFVLPTELHIPIAVKSKVDLEKFVGQITEEISMKGSNKAFILHREPNAEFKLDLPIWKKHASSFFHEPKQVWVNVNYTRYRNAFLKAFPNMLLDKKVIDHIMNRRQARDKGFKYIRLVAIDRTTNTGSGATTEKWGVNINRKEIKKVKAKYEHQKVQYADICDLVKMININPGGGYMESLRLMQDWIDG